MARGRERVRSTLALVAVQARQLVQRLAVRLEAFGGDAPLALDAESFLLTEEASGLHP